jgi:4-amino-4-deoxy-L-arabinose transferase-like glycosyltransferase
LGSVTVMLVALAAALHADGFVYANHPPITGLVTAASMTAVGRSEAGVRLVHDAAGYRLETAKRLGQEDARG